MEAIQTPPVNYQDYIPTDSILCPICGISTSSLQGLNRVKKNKRNKQMASHAHSTSISIHNIVKKTLKELFCLG